MSYQTRIQTTIQSTHTPTEILALLKSIPSIQQEPLQIQKVSELCSFIKHYEDNVEMYITKDFCNELLIQIGEGQSKVQKAILSFICEIAEIGTDKESSFEKNQFYKTFKQTGLKQKLWNILLNQIEIDKKELKRKNSSNSTLNIIQTFAFINKNLDIKNEQMSSLGKVIISKINKLIEMIKQKSKDLKKNKINMKDSDIELENEIMYGSRTLESIYALLECNEDYFIENYKIHKLISILIHINCPSELKCSQLITIPEYNTIQDLQGSLFNIFNKLMFDYNITKYLIENHSLFEHIYPIIVHFVQSLPRQQKKQSSSSPQINEQYSSILIVSGAINILIKLLEHDYPFSNQAALTPNLGTSLIPILNFNRKIHINKKIDKLSEQMRHNSYMCFWHFFNHGSELNRNIMISEWRLVQTLIECVGTGSGNEEENNEMIRPVLFFVANIFSYINRTALTTSTFSDISRNLKGYFEEQGSCEEIEAHLFHQRMGQNEQMNNRANELKNQMNKIKKHQ